MCDLSICVLTHNRSDQVLETIKNLKNEFGDQFEILVLNNGSDDSTQTNLLSVFGCDSSVKVFESLTNLGVSEGRKYLWERTKSEYILSMDDDIIISSRSLNSMFLNIVEGKGIGLVSPSIKDSVSGKIINGAGRKGLPTFYEACFLVSTKVVQSVGSFDARLMYAGEGLDYALRMRKLGFSVFRDTTATVIHYDRERTKLDAARRRQRWLWSFCYVYWKNLGILEAAYWSLRNIFAHIRTGFPTYGVRFVASLPKFAFEGMIAGFRSRD